MKKIMKNIIYCFSGTGNCMDAAIKMANVLGDTTIISMRNDSATVPSEDAAVIGFVFPVHHWSLPEQAKTFIRAVTINPKAYIFGVTVCGGISFNTLYEFTNIIKAKGAVVAYTHLVRTVSSYVAAYEPFPSPEKILPKASNEIDVVCEEIKQQKHTVEQKENKVLKGIRNIVQPHFVKQLPVKDKSFVVSSDCVSCGLCERICIANNIKIIDGKPTFLHKCTQCMGCIAYCPKGAINYKNITQKRNKYHNPNVAASDLSKKEIVIVK